MRGVPGATQTRGSGYRVHFLTRVFLGRCMEFFGRQFDFTQRRARYGDKSQLFQKDTRREFLVEFNFIHGYCYMRFYFDRNESAGKSDGACSGGWNQDISYVYGLVQYVRWSDGGNEYSLRC